MMTVGAGARAQITVEILGLGSWGHECRIEQVYAQAAEAAIGRIRKMLEAELKVGTSRLIGEPRVTMVFTESE